MYFQPALAHLDCDISSDLEKLDYLFLVCLIRVVAKLCRTVGLQERVEDLGFRLSPHVRAGQLRSVRAAVLQNLDPTPIKHT